MAPAATIRPMSAPLITLLTDFGLRDPSAAICAGVILGIAPDARILDISHEVRKYAVRDGALLLWCALPYLPVGIHVAVVDPGVGTARRPVAIRVGRGDVLIGPDNGLLLPVTDRLGGVVEARELTEAAYRLPVVSTSFHGRDIFAPAAAHLATGVPFDRIGPTIDPGDLVRLRWPEPEIGDGALRTSVIYRDTFGNVKLAALADDLTAALGGLEPGDRLTLAFAASGEAPARSETMTWQRTFGSVASGTPLVYEDSYGRLCVAVNQGDAVTRFGIVDDQRVSIRRA